jgi:hypothetical protein
MFYDLGPSTAPFLPSSPNTTKEELRVAVLQNLDATIDLIKPIPLETITMESLQTIPLGVYRIKEPATVRLLQSSVGSTYGEIGLFRIHSRWFISINHDMQSRFPQILDVVLHCGIFEKEIHTHPDSIKEAYPDFKLVHLPSPDDLVLSDSTSDGRQYIVSSKGVTELTTPKTFPSQFPSLHDVGTWKHKWSQEQKKLYRDQHPHLSFSESDAFYNEVLPDKFFQTFFGMRIIPWENVNEIQSILN